MKLDKKNSLLILVLAAVFLFAGSKINAEEAENSAGIEEQKTVPYNLSLEEAIRLSLENNFDIQIAKYDAKIAKTKKGVAESIYDTVLGAEIKYRNDQSKNASTIAGTKTLDNDYNLSLSKKLPIGATATVDMLNNRHWTNSAFTTLSPSHDSALGLTVEQELGKNFFGIQDRGSIKITKLDIENSKYTSLDKIESTIAETQKAYWDLVSAYARLAVAQDMLKEAERLYNLHQEKIKNGLVEFPEALASEANYKKRKNEYLLAENNAQVQSNVVKLLLNIPEQNIDIRPASYDFAITDKKEDGPVSLKAAFENRRDYKSEANNVKAKDIQLSMDKNNLWPEINLTASLARNGIGEHFPDAAGQITDEDNPDFFAGLIFTLPLENTKARSELQASQIEKAKAIINLKFLERKIMVRVIDQVRTCNVLLERFFNAREIARLQEQKLQEEQKRFQGGRSGTDTIIRFQEDLIQAKWDETQAARDYQVAVVDLRKDEGSLLNPYWKDESL